MTEAADTSRSLCVEANEQAIEQAAVHIREGRLVAFPTETVYGLGADATDPHAVARIFETKGRPRLDPLIVHVANIVAAKQFTTHWPALADQLAQTFWPGPLTMIMPRTSAIPDIVTGGLADVGLRVPAHPVARRLIETAQRPIAAPSANRFGRISPTRAEHVLAELGDAPDLAMVLDGGACERGVESTVVRLVSSPEPSIEVLRLGGIPLEQLERLAPVRVIRSNVDDNTQAAQASPGTLSRHYAPGTPLVVAADVAALVQSLHDAEESAALGLLCLNRQACGEARLDRAGLSVCELSPRGDLVEAAGQLFQTMRTMDAMGLTRIIALAVPERGLGRAINDRLMRASRP